MLFWQNSKFSLFRENVIISKPFQKESVLIKLKNIFEKFCNLFKLLLSKIANTAFYLSLL